jgi:hypothetical protein
VLLEYPQVSTVGVEPGGDMEIFRRKQAKKTPLKEIEPERMTRVKDKMEEII